MFLTVLLTNFIIIGFLILVERNGWQMKQKNNKETKKKKKTNEEFPII